MAAVVRKVTRELDTLGLSDLEKAVVKATYEDDDPPKEKHVLEMLTLSRTGKWSDVVKFLQKRMKHSGWRVVLKALLLFLRTVRAGSPMILKDFADNPEYADLRGFEDKTTEGHQYSSIVVNYSVYLTAKAASFRRLEICVERELYHSGPEWGINWIQKASTEDLFLIAEAVQYQAKMLLLCDMQSPKPHAVVEYAMVELWKDFTNLYNFLTMIALHIADEYENWDTRNLKSAVEYLKSYTSLNPELKKWTESLVRLHTIKETSVPKFDRVPEDLLDLVESALAGGVKKRKATKSKDKAVKVRSPSKAAVEDDEEPSASKSKSRGKLLLSMASASKSSKVEERESSDLKKVNEDDAEAEEETEEKSVSEVGDDEFSFGKKPTARTSTFGIKSPARKPSKKLSMSAEGTVASVPVSVPSEESEEDFFSSAAKDSKKKTSVRKPSKKISISPEPRAGPLSSQADVRKEKPEELEDFFATPSSPKSGDDEDTEFMSKKAKTSKKTKASKKFSLATDETAKGAVESDFLDIFGSTAPAKPVKANESFDDFFSS